MVRLGQEKWKLKLSITSHWLRNRPSSYHHRHVHSVLYFRQAHWASIHVHVVHHQSGIELRRNAEGKNGEAQRAHGSIKSSIRHDLRKSLAKRTQSFLSSLGETFCDSDFQCSSASTSLKIEDVLQPQKHGLSMKTRSNDAQNTTLCNEQ
jgi:hypothetical protein